MLSASGTISAVFDSDTQCDSVSEVLSSPTINRFWIDGTVNGSHQISTCYIIDVAECLLVLSGSSCMQA